MKQKKVYFLVFYFIESLVQEKRTNFDKTLIKQNANQRQKVIKYKKVNEAKKTEYCNYVFRRPRRMNQEKPMSPLCLVI